MAYEQKTKPTAVEPGAFVRAVEHPTRRADGLALLELMEHTTGQPPVMWGPSIIGFGQRHYKYASGHEGDEPLVGFSPRKASLVIYGLTYTPGHEELLEQLGKHKRGKGCVYVNKLADVDLGVLERLIKLNYDHRASDGS